MTGYRIIFDREKLVLGWKKSDCRFCFNMICILGLFMIVAYKKLYYITPIDLFAGNDIENSSTPITPGAAKVPPAVAVGVGNATTSKSPKDTRNFSESQSSVASPLFERHLLTCISLLFILFPLL